MTACPRAGRKRARTVPDSRGANIVRAATLATLAAAALAATLAVPANAQRVPPRGALPLSQIIAGVEKSQPVSSFREVEWDDDGYRDMEFINTNNRTVNIRIDPMTGEPWSRRSR
ncbi:MAG: PepSY domain-containing protein [Amaricoccus sp.]|uniref:PepSY domain-containing protein n=1 Tax=Amaricoccus sp. TaxID=1872485 RepID=UPI0039E43BB1